jgi:hypothetical protein
MTSAFLTCANVSIAVEAEANTGYVGSSNRHGWESYVLVNFIRGKKNVVYAIGLDIVNKVDELIYVHTYMMAAV